MYIVNDGDTRMIQFTPNEGTSCLLETEESIKGRIASAFGFNDDDIILLETIGDPTGIREGNLKFIACVSACFEVLGRGYATNFIDVWRDLRYDDPKTISTPNEWYVPPKEE